jgi:hypothetical protein
MLCVVCTMHKVMMSMSFLVEPQNQGRRFVSDLASKPLGRVSRFSFQKRQLWFGDLCLKITVTVSFFGPQNQADFGFSVAPQNRQREDGAGHVLRSVGLLHLEISRAKVSQFGIKTGVGVMTGGACGTITEDALGSS